MKGKVGHPNLAPAFPRHAGGVEISEVDRRTVFSAEGAQVRQLAVEGFQDRTGANPNLPAGIGDVVTKIDLAHEIQMVGVDGAGDASSRDRDQPQLRSRLVAS